MSKENPDSIHGQADALQEKVLTEHAKRGQEGNEQGAVEAAGTVIRALEVDERRALMDAKAHGSADPERVILGSAEVPEGMEGVLLWDKINTLVADYGEKREGELWDDYVCGACRPQVWFLCVTYSIFR